MSSNFTHLDSDPILKRFRLEVGALFGDRLEHLVMFGSRARGDATADSDYDIAVFLKNFDNRDSELEKISDIEFDIMCETGKHIHALSFYEKAYDQRTLFMHEIRKDGIDLS